MEKKEENINDSVGESSMDDNDSDFKEESKSEGIEESYVEGSKNKSGSIEEVKKRTKKGRICLFFELLVNFFRQMKELTFILFLSLSNVTNFAILNLPYILSGVFFSFFLLNRYGFSLGCKNTIVKLITIYNYLAIITKVIVAIIYLSVREVFSNEPTKSLLIDMGFVFLKDRSSTSCWLNTFLCDGLVLIGMILLGMYGYKSKNYIEQRSFLVKNYSHYYQIFAHLSIIIMSILSSLNLNIITIIFTVIINICLLFYLFETQCKVFLYCSYLIVSCCIFNIFSSQLMSFNIIRTYFTNQIALNLLEYIQFNYKITNYTLNVTLFILTVLSIKLSNTYLNEQSLPTNHKIQNRVSEESEEEHKDTEYNLGKDSLFSDLKDKFFEWLVSPYFILHFCRIFVIVIINMYESSISTFLFSWVFISFLITNLNLLLYLTLFIAWPVLIIIFYCYYIANIKTFFDKEPNDIQFFKSFSLEALNYKQVHIVFLYFVFLSFTIFTKLLVKYKQKPSKEIKVEIKKIMKGTGNNLKETLLSDKQRFSHNQEASFVKVLFKFLLNHIGKITLILMYFIAVNNISVVHFILMIIFLIQLIFPKAIKHLCFSIMLTLQVLILAGHTWKLIQGYIKITPYLISVLEFIMRIDENWDPSDEHFLWVLLYCYYLQYRNFNSDIYLKYDSDKFKLKTYLENNLKYYESMNKIMKTVISFLESLYIWFIFVLIFLTITLFEIQCLFALKLFFFFLIVYKYLQFSYSKRITNTIVIYIRIFVIYCGLVTMMIYFYQFTGLSLISKWYEPFIKSFKDHTNFNNKNFIGIKLFEKSELTLKLFPHYFSNFLSVLLLNEMTRILHTSHNEEYLISSFFLEKGINKKIETFEKDIEEYFDCDLNSKEIIILKEKEIYYNETKYKYSKNKYYIFKVLLFFTNTYWWMFLLILCSIITTYQISAIMLLYIIVIGVSFILIFNKFYNNIQKKSSLFYITKLIRFYQLEHKVQRRIILNYKAATYKILIMIPLFSIFCIYVSGIMDKVNEIIPYPTKYIAITYVFGTYYNNQSNFFTNIWGHLLMLVLLISERYISRLSLFLHLEILKTERFKSIVNGFKNKAKSKENNPNQAEISEKSISEFFPQPKQTDVCLRNEGSKVPFEPNCDILMKTFAGDVLIEKEEIPENEMKSTQREFKPKDSFNQRFSSVNRERQFYERVESNVGVPPSKLFRKFLLIFYNRKFHPNQKDIPNSNLSLDLQMSIKYISEEVIVFMVFCCAVFKMNIFSVFYLLIILILQIKGRNVRNLFILQIILTLFIIIQYSLFLMNLNPNSDPSKLSDSVKDKLNSICIPLFNNIGIDNYRFLFYLSAGTTYSQVLSLWTDFITLLFCCLYLENFSYSVFDSEKKPKFNINIVQEKGSVREALSKIDSLEYNEFKESLQYNFGIVLKDLQDIRKDIKSFSFYNKFKVPYIEKKGSKDIGFKKSSTIRKSRLSDQQVNSFFLNKVEKKSRILRIVHFLKKSVYLTMHNIMLIMILILSLFNDCLISLFYITFALYYIYMARGLFLAQKWNFPKAIINFLRPFMLVDISIQILYQNPLNIYLIANYQTLVSLLKYIGISTLINYDNIIDTNYNQERSQMSILLILKIISYVFVSLQIIIYGSKDFKSFYITFLFKKKESTYRSSMMYTFLFNNYRMKIMNSSMNYRNQITEVQDNLEKQLEQWNENLKVDLENAMKNRRLQYFDPKLFEYTVSLRNKLNNLNKTSNKPLSNRNEKKTSVVSLPASDKEVNNFEVPLNFSVEHCVLQVLRRFIYSRFLVGLAISLNRYICSYKYMEKEFKKEMEEEVIKGETHIMSTVERIIENYLINLDFNNEVYNNLILLVKNEIEPQTNMNMNKEEGGLDMKTEEKVDSKEPLAEDNIESKVKCLVEKEEELTKKNSYNTQNSKGSSNRNDTLYSNDEQSFSIGAKNEKINKELNDIFLKEKLFKTELSNTFLLRYIMKNIFYFFLDNFHYLCYFFMVLNHIMNHSLISVFWPLVVFGYALIEYPRPKNRFWRLCLFYSILVILFKFSLTLTRNPLSSFTKNETMNNLTNNYTLEEYNDEYKIGISLFTDSLSIDFFNYIFWDSILIFLIAMEQYMLITQGLWKRVEPQLESMQEAYDRVYLANSEKFKNVDSNMFLYYKSISLFKTKAEKLEAKKRRKWCVQLTKCNVLKSYYKKTFPKIRNNKPGKDFYTYYFIATLLLVCYIIIFYTYMDRNLNFQISTNQKIRQFSGGMVVVAFLHVGLIVIDRIIYIKQSRQNISHQYFYYNKDNGEKSSETEFLKKNLTEEEQLRYEKIYFQKEDLNYPMIIKYLMHLVVIVLSHFLVFWYLPIKGNNNLNNINFCEKKAINQQCNDFLNNNFLIFFYILYLIYFTFSSLQIQHGLLDTKKKSVLMRGDNLFNLILFKTYKAIPFLYELKLTIDWSITPTSLDIFKWIKFESVYDLLFITHCTMKQEKSREIGEKIGLLEKISFGGIGFSLILLILIGPLMLFSTLNPQNSNNNVSGASIKMSLCFKEKDFTNNFTLFTNENPFQLTSMDNLTMYYFNYSKSVYTKNFASEQIQKIIMYNYSDSAWSVSEPHLNLIIDRINNFSNYHFDIYLSFEFSFKRPQAGLTYNSFDFELYRSNKLGSNLIHERQNLIEILKRNIVNCSKEPIFLNQLYFPAIRLNTELHPSILEGDDSLSKLDGTIMFVCSTFMKNNRSVVDYSNAYWTLNVMTPVDKTKNITLPDQNTGIRFYTFSDLVSSTSLSFDVMTFYISFVLLLGNLIRNFISGEAERIVITEMPEPQKILNLCEGIKISRYRHDFIREEHLFCVLIDMMRSPEILKKITKSSLQFLIEKNEEEMKMEGVKSITSKKNE